APVYSAPCDDGISWLTRVAHVADHHPAGQCNARSRRNLAATDCYHTAVAYSRQRFRVERVELGCHPRVSAAIAAADGNKQGNPRRSSDNGGSADDLFQRVTGRRTDWEARGPLSGQPGPANLFRV